MKKSPIRYLILGKMINRTLIKYLIVLLLLNSCSISINRNLNRIEKRSLKPDELESIINNEVSKVLFKAQIQLHDKYFSGLLFVKSFDSNTKRVVFVTELGIKVFEFEYKNDDFTVYHCLEMFNRKSILNTLKKDINMLLMHDLKRDKAKIYLSKESGNKVYKVKMSNQHYYYYIDRKTGHVNKVENSSGFLRKVNIEINEYKDDFPNNINIVHPFIKLTINLKLIESYDATE